MGRQQNAVWQPRAKKKRPNDPAVTQMAFVRREWLPQDGHFNRYTGFSSAGRSFTSLDGRTSENCCRWTVISFAPESTCAQLWFCIGRFYDIYRKFEE